MWDRCHVEGSYYKECFSINEMLLWAIDPISFNQWTFIITFDKRYSIKFIQDILHQSKGHIFFIIWISSWPLIVSLLKYTFSFFIIFVSKDLFLYYSILFFLCRWPIYAPGSGVWDLQEDRACGCSEGLQWKAWFVRFWQI